MRNIKPIYLMHESGVECFQLEAVIAGISEILQLAGVSSEIQIKNFGAWRNDNWQENGQLTMFNSIDWYLERAWKNSDEPGQLNGGSFIRDFQITPWRKAQPHYDVVVLKSDMYSEGVGFVIGLAVECVGTVISVARFCSLERNLQIECLKTEIIHEAGHVFGLPPNDRQDNIEYSIGKHCLNFCTMRQGLEVPEDWIRITGDRLQSGAFCPQCQKDLQRFFR